VHITSKTGAVEVPNSGKQQTSAAVADFDNDGINDFCISERTSAPGMVWYGMVQKSRVRWKKYKDFSRCEIYLPGPAIIVRYK